MAAALSELTATLGALAGMCGEDSQGRAFAASYEPAARTVQTATGGIERGLASIEVSLGVMADNYAGSDVASSSLLDGR